MQEDSEPKFAPVGQIANLLDGLRKWKWCISFIFCNGDDEFLKNGFVKKKYFLFLICNAFVTLGLL